MFSLSATLQESRFNSKTLKRTRKFVIEGVEVSVTTSKIIGDDEKKDEEMRFLRQVNSSQLDPTRLESCPIVHHTLLEERSLTHMGRHVADTQDSSICPLKSRLKYSFGNVGTIL